MEKTPQYKVIVSDRARQMLAGHVRFLAQKSPTAARKTNAIMGTGTLISKPDKGKYCCTATPVYRRCISRWTHIIY